MAIFSITKKKRIDNRLLIHILFPPDPEQAHDVGFLQSSVLLKVPACMKAPLPHSQKQGDYSAPGLVFENNQSGLWRGSLVIFPTRPAISVASPCSCME